MKHCRLIVVALILGLGLSCSPKATTTGVPGAPSSATSAQTIQFRLTKAIAIIAESNKAATQATIALNRQKLIADPLTKEILNYNAQVSTAARAALTIIDSPDGFGGETPASLREKATAVVALMRKLALPDNVKRFIDSGASDTAITGAIAALTSVQLAITLVTTFQGGQ